MKDSINIKEIARLYSDGKSAAEIGDYLGTSWRKIIYLMEKNNIKRRTRSEATYRKLNPQGNPFVIKNNLTKDEKELKTLALGLYLNDGITSNAISVRLSNSNPNLINIFLNFLQNICGVKAEKIKLSLNLHSDVSLKRAEQYWSKQLNVSAERFNKSVVINSKGNGVHRKKSLYGTATVCVHNMKLRKILQGWIKDMVKNHANIVQSGKHRQDESEVSRRWSSSVGRARPW